MDIFRKRFLDGLKSTGKREFTIHDIKQQAGRFRITSKDAVILCNDLEKCGMVKSFGRQGYKRFRARV